MGMQIKGLIERTKGKRNSEWIAKNNSKRLSSYINNIEYRKIKIL